MEPQILRLRHKTIEIIGRLSYEEGYRAWSTIRFKKRLINEFPDLEEKRAIFSYKMVLYQTPRELEKAVREMKKEDKPLPILLYLVKEREAD